MPFYKILLLFIILFCVMLFVAYILQCNNQTNENMIDVSKLENTVWSRNQCPYNMNETLTKVLNDNQINHGDKDWQLFFPCTYDNIDEEINNINIKNNTDQRFFIINNADFLIGKDYLWKYLINYHGLEKSKTLMPMTYILNESKDLEQFKKNYNPDELYILKKNIQRQEGLKISNSLNEIMNAKEEGYVIVQNLLQNPYLIGGRKINLRFYILVICKEENMDVYVYNNGFMYYTKDLFKKNSKEFGPNITTGYIDRWVYDVHPLTHQDFREYLDKHDRQLSTIEKQLIDRNIIISEYVFDKVYNLINEIFVSFIGKICGGKLNNFISFQLFGADIAIDDQLNPQVMEINKGPDMGAKDDRDGKVKYECMQDVLKLIGVVNKDRENNGFIKVLDYEKN
ncbi:tubulin-tyrosine ligase family protein [Catovirus CTV1]|uniref:Tubulin-tyrosine ligase family protein n=1 Tax=Catovirus CTV1 TaxID=1977631 RepID=A0A1V0SC80_9VIRU|nr:tubulin-tyrosine ligase family protein [Catovirus CTV1]